jgi:hypothetical protein
MKPAAKLRSGGTIAGDRVRRKTRSSLIGSPRSGLGKRQVSRNP